MRPWQWWNILQIICRNQGKVKKKPVPQCPTVRFCGRTSFMLSRSPLCASAPDSPLPRDRRIHRGGPTSTAHSAPLLFPIIHQITPELRNNGGSEVSFPTSLTHIEGFSSPQSLSPWKALKGCPSVLSVLMKLVGLRYLWDLCQIRLK